MDKFTEGNQTYTASGMLLTENMVCSYFILVMPRLGSLSSSCSVIWKIGL